MKRFRAGAEPLQPGAGTDTTGPVVQRVGPPSGFTGVPINAPVQILFNEPISGASLAGVTATLHPNATLISGVTYTMYVGSPYVSYYLYDLGGNALYGTYISFTTPVRQCGDRSSR